jgi:hypothetical protein
MAPLSRVKMPSGEGTMEGGSGEKDNVRASIVPAGPARVAGRLAAWNACLDSNTISCRGRLIAAVVVIGEVTCQLSTRLRPRLLQQSHQQTRGHYRTIGHLAEMAKIRVGPPTSSVTTIESPIRPCFQKWTSLLYVKISILDGSTFMGTLTRRYQLHERGSTPVQGQVWA